MPPTLFKINISRRPPPSTPSFNVEAPRKEFAASFFFSPWSTLMWGGGGVCAYARPQTRKLMLILKRVEGEFQFVWCLHALVVRFSSMIVSLLSRIRRARSTRSVVDRPEETNREFSFPPSRESQSDGCLLQKEIGFPPQSWKLND